MFVKLAPVALSAIISLTMAFATPVLAHHGHNHQGEGHTHDGTPGGTFPAFEAPGHCKHHPHGCGPTVTALEPSVVLTVGAGLAGAIILRRKLKK